MWWFLWIIIKRSECERKGFLKSQGWQSRLTRRWTHTNGVNVITRPPSHRTGAALPHPRRNLWLCARDHQLLSCLLHLIAFSKRKSSDIFIVHLENTPPKPKIRCVCCSYFLLGANGSFVDKPQVTIFPASNKIVLTGSQDFVTEFFLFSFSPQL